MVGMRAVVTAWQGHVWHRCHAWHSVQRQHICLHPKALLCVQDAIVLTCWDWLLQGAGAEGHTV